MTTFFPPRCRWLFGAAMAVLCLLSLCANADTPVPASAEQAVEAKEARAGIQRAYDQINAAFAERDLTRTMSFFAPDYVVVDEKGARFNKEQARQQYQKQLAQIKTMHSAYVVQIVMSKPEGTLVELKLHMSGTGEKRILFVKVHGTFTDDLWVRDLWVNTPQGWRLKSRQTLQNDMRIHH